jgi:hypothetical protein
MWTHTRHDNIPHKRWRCTVFCFVTGRPLFPLPGPCQQSFWQMARYTVCFLTWQHLDYPPLPADNDFGLTDYGTETENIWMWSWYKPYCCETKSGDFTLTGRVGILIQTILLRNKERTRETFGEGQRYLVVARFHDYCVSHVTPTPWHATPCLSRDTGFVRREHAFCRICTLYK